VIEVVVMSETDEEGCELLSKYNDLVYGIAMIRRAVDKASRAGVLPYEPIGITPLEECERLARAIYTVAEKQGRAFPWGDGPQKGAVH
jgi:hypothetical protein